MAHFLLLLMTLPLCLECKMLSKMMDYKKFFVLFFK